MCEKVMCDDGIEREVISRKEAKEQGLVRYFTGKACKHGHVAERVTNNLNCVTCAGRQTSEQLREMESERWALDDDGVRRKVTTREQALVNQEPYYFTGKPCANGHVSLRETKHSKCLECRKGTILRNRPVMDGSFSAVDDKGVERPVIDRQHAREQGLSYYFTGEPCKYGHIAQREVKRAGCLECGRLRHYSRKDKPEYKKWRREYKREYVKENREKIREYYRKYERDNRERRNERTKERTRTDPMYRLKVSCRNMLSRVLTATGSAKNNRTHKELGYCHEQLMEHLESLMLEGMTWDNFGSEWHIDHLNPITRLIEAGETNAKKINAFDNLAPMWKEHNSEKSNRTLEEYLEIRPDLEPLYGRLLNL